MQPAFTSARMDRAAAKPPPPNNALYIYMISLSLSPTPTGGKKKEKRNRETQTKKYNLINWIYYIFSLVMLWLNERVTVSVWPFDDQTETSLTVNKKKKIQNNFVITFPLFFYYCFCCLYCVYFSSLFKFLLLLLFLLVVCSCFIFMHPLSTPTENH